MSTVRSKHDQEVSAAGPGISILRGDGLALEALLPLASRPPLFEPSAASIWKDPYVSTQMLAAHLDPSTDAPSRRPETIDAEVEWMVSRLELSPGDAVLDLGCGPGLYSMRLARRGLQVTGVDFSPLSIAHARETAEKEELSITYRGQDYLTLEDTDAFHAVLLIHGDFCVLPDRARDLLLDHIHRALRPGGFFVFDAMTLASFALEQPGTRWEVKGDGFWRPVPHLLLEQRFTYPDEAVSLHQYSILDEQGELTVYHVWSRYYSLETLTPVLERHGFSIQELGSDLHGTRYSQDSHMLGMVAMRK